MCQTDIDKLIESKKIVSIINSDKKQQVLYPLGNEIIKCNEVDSDLQIAWSEVKLPEDEISLDFKLLKFGALSKSEVESGHAQRARFKNAQFNKPGMKRKA